MTIEIERLTIAPAKEADILTLHHLFNLPESQNGIRGKIRKITAQRHNDDRKEKLP